MSLAHRMDARVLLVLIDVLERLILTRLFQVRLKAWFSIEVVFDRLLTRSGDKQDIGDARVGGFAHNVLDRGAVNDGKHLLGDRLRDGQEAGSATGRRDNGVHYRLVFI